MSLGTVIQKCHSRSAVLGVVPAEHGNALGLCQSILAAGHAVTLLEPDPDKVRAYHRQHNPFSAPMPDKLRRHSEFSVTALSGGIGLYDVVFVAGDWFGLSNRDRKAYGKVLQAVGEQVRPAAEQMVIIHGRIEPGFVGTVVPETLLLGGMLKVPQHMRVGYIVRHTLSPMMISVAGDNISIGRVTRAIAEDVYPIHFGCIQVTTPDTLEGISLAEAAHTAANRALLYELRGSLGLVGCNATDVLLSTRTLQSGTPDMRPVGGREYIALDRLVKQVGRSGMRFEAVKQALALEKRACERVVDRLLDELHNRNIRARQAKVVVVGATEGEELGATRWKNSLLWEYLGRAGITPDYYDIAYHVHARMRRNDRSVASVLSGGYDAAIIVTAQPSATHNVIARKIRLVLDTCGACDPRHGSVIQV